MSKKCENKTNDANYFEYAKELARVCGDYVLLKAHINYIYDYLMDEKLLLKGQDNPASYESGLHDGIEKVCYEMKRKFKDVLESR